MIYGQPTIGRNVTVTHCNGQRVTNTREGPVFEDFSIDVYGCYTAERATTYVRRLVKDSSIVINNVEHETHHYKMKIQDFIKYGERTS